MSGSLDSLQVKIMGLSSAERLQLLEQLIAGLDQDEPLERDWDDLAIRRLDDVQSGRLESEPAELVISRLESLFP
ncbi:MULTISPECIES: addiction module protein [unclassified Cyanobium]|uniref:addiction module protein n=1 Tax=unclassified Cyanobium TaxID=2627006 RepID=UPI0020CE73F0|nr:MULTISPECIES: addiction module protein [unclassified Cyanobium]MCP9860143.1 addiction module protein [Cyanobium sp. Cruz-8H5]MCP9867393.1 addiction module protein [Cyanobium sp. Cruz-8D1]